MATSTALGPCGCDLLAGRCGKHAAMMQAIYGAWYQPLSGEPDRRPAIWAASDGYGEPGLVPGQGYDWSGIRDSSIEAVEAMYRAAVAGHEGTGPAIADGKLVCTTCGLPVYAGGRLRQRNDQALVRRNEMAGTKKAPRLEAMVEDDRVVVKYAGLVLDIGPTGDGEGLTVEAYPYGSRSIYRVEREDWTRGRYTDLATGEVQTFRAVPR